MASWPTLEEQEAAEDRGCTCAVHGPDLEQDPYCVEHGDRMIMRATLDKLRVALEWYADPLSHVRTQIKHPCTAASGDAGKRARAALGIAP